jgi:hypothetical protein
MMRSAVLPSSSREDAESQKMKGRLITAAIVATMARALLAQEPPLPAATSTPAVSPSTRPELNIPDIPITVEPTPLVPNVGPAPDIAPATKKQAPAISELDAAFGKSSMGQEVEEQRMHIEWRKLQNRTSQDPEVVAARKAADAAQTDVEKRELRRTYYKIFYAHMQALADTPEVKSYLEQKKNNILNTLAQPHVRPEETPRPKAKR